LLPTMTANVRIVTDQKDGVLKVPNAALRFRPPGLEGEQRERPGPGGQRTGGGPGSGGGFGAGGGQGLGQGSGGREARAGGAGRARVWVLDPTGKPKPVPIQIGISDGTSTEVTGGDLTDQQQVIVGVGGADRPTGPGSPGQGGPRLRL